jgi:flagellar hook-length control protein FliK
MNASTPRGLDVRSQAWRENLLETARLRMPGLGAAGTLQTITLQLQPRLMGTVTMTLALTASGGVQLRLGASSERTRRFFTAEAPAIAASFARGGLNVSRIEILENQSDRFV